MTDGQMILRDSVTIVLHQMDEDLKTVEGEDSADLPWQIRESHACQSPNNTYCRKPMVSETEDVSICVMFSKMELRIQGCLEKLAGMKPWHETIFTNYWNCFWNLNSGYKDYSL